MEDKNQNIFTKHLNPKTSWIILGILVVILMSSVIYCCLQYCKDSATISLISTPISTNTNPSNEQNGNTAAEPLTVLPKEKSMMLAYGATTLGAKMFNLVNNSMEDKDLTLPETLLPSSYQSAYVNNSVQWSNNGQVMAFAYGDWGGMAAPETPNSFKLDFIKNNNRVTILENLEVAQVPKWLLMPDGKSIIYIKSDENNDKAKCSLYKYDIETKQHQKLVDDVTDYAHTGSEITASAQKNAIYIINNKASDKYKKLYKYEYSFDTNSSSEQLLCTETNNIATDMTHFALSPDEKFATYDVQSGEHEFALNLLNLDSGEVTELVKSGDKRAFNNNHWSHDGKNVVVETTYYGTGSLRDGELQLWQVNIDSKEKTVLDTMVAGNSTGIYNYGWSPDDKYIAYDKGKILMLYNLSSQSSQTIIDASQFSDIAPKGLAWVKF